MGQGVRRVLENIVLFVDLTVFDLGDFCPDALEGINEAVDLEFVLAFGRLNHETTDDWPGHSRCVETVVH